MQPIEEIVENLVPGNLRLIIRFDYQQQRANVLVKLFGFRLVDIQLIIELRDSFVNYQVGAVHYNSKHH